MTRTLPLLMMKKSFPSSPCFRISVPDAYERSSKDSISVSRSEFESARNMSIPASTLWLKLCFITLPSSPSKVVKLSRVSRSAVT